MEKNKNCPNCGGNLTFDPTTKSLKCEKCETLTEIKKGYDISTHEYSTPLQKNLRKQTYNCQNCGASIPLTELEVSKICPYCGSSVVFEFSSTPDGIIPFEFNKQTAVNYFRQNLKKKAFLPNKFKKNPSLYSLNAFYIPSFSFNCNTSSTYSGTLAHTHTDSDGKSHTTYQHISGKIDLNFSNTLIESSSKLSQSELNEIVPYKFNDKCANKYSSDFIRGYSVENYNNSLENCRSVHDKQIKEKIKQKILSGYSYSYVDSFSLKANIFNVTYSYILLPVYSISIEYKQKRYITYLNGQTGKLGNNLPKSKLKITLLVIGILFVFIGIPLLIYLLGN